MALGWPPARLSPLKIGVHCDSARYPRDLEAAVYFCCSEAIQNVVKHACASRGSVHVWCEDGKLHFTVQDDGHGFQPQAVVTGGLQNMRDRLEALGGEMLVSSDPPWRDEREWLAPADWFSFARKRKPVVARNQDRQGITAHRLRAAHR